MRGIICGALMLLTVTASAAQNAPLELTTKFVLPVCTRDQMDMLVNADKTDALHYGGCYGTLFGISLMLGFFKAVQQQPDPRICTDIPNSVKPTQMLDVVVKYAGSHSESANEAFGVTAFRALHERWPCKK